MLDHALEAAFAAFMQSNPAFTGIHLFTGHNSEDHHLPCVTVSSKSEPLAGSADIFRSELTFRIESEAHDNKPDEHAGFVENVRASLINKRSVITAINAGGRIFLYGYSYVESSLDVDGNHFRTSITLKVGYGIP